MKFTLAFDIYNKEQWIQSLLESWLDNLSRKHEYEVVIVFDASKDASPEIAEKVLQTGRLDYEFLYADDEYEIYCTDLAFQHATGDFIVFIQDDNWIYDRDWDDTLVQVLRRFDNIGVVGLLAGLEMKKGPGLRYRRVEVNRPHKGDRFWVSDNFDLAVWSVDAICRPFGISTKLLREMGGLDFAFRPTCGDDLDLSLKLLRKGYTNLYIPFDIKNSVGSRSTMAPDFVKSVYSHAVDLCVTRHGELIRRRVGTNLRKLLLMEEQSGVLCIRESTSIESHDLRVRLARVLVPVWIANVYDRLHRFSFGRMRDAMKRRIQRITCLVKEIYVARRAE